MTRFLGSIARELLSILPRSSGGRVLVASFVVLTAVRLLGQSQAKLASFLSWLADPWIMLEIAWEELPAPLTDEILLAQGDYGSVRGFLHPRGNHLRALERRTWWVSKSR